MKKYLIKTEYSKPNLEGSVFWAFSIDEALGVARQQLRGKIVEIKEVKQ